MQLIITESQHPYLDGKMKRYLLYAHALPHNSSGHYKADHLRRKIEQVSKDF